MGNLSGLTIGNTTFPVGAGGGGSAMPIHIQLPKSASDSTYSGLDMLAWPDGKRYVYATTDSASRSAFIPPEYMGVGSVYISRATQIMNSAIRASSSLYSFTMITVYDTVIGDSTNGATVSFAAFKSGNAGTSSADWPDNPGSTSMTFYVNPGATP